MQGGDENQRQKIERAHALDQFGVELGKSMAKAIERGGESFDASTEALLDAAGMAQ